ncbi:MAG: FAD-binding protein [Spirochaetes bacterium]|nr:MAG: FAD-binding protein [Spirochaetota bacterium]
MSGINLLTALSDNIVVDRDKCVACGICVEKCPVDNLRLKLSPCRQACPLGVNAQGYVRLIARGEEEKAIELVRETLPFPGILGRVCSQPCEAGCHHAAIGSESIGIRALKRYLADRFPGTAAPLPRMEPVSGKRAAIIGSGPAGLMAAYELRAHGHETVVFDAEPEPGGMLRWAIPEFRLPANVLRDEIGLLERMGVVFKCGTRIDTDGMGSLRREFGAVILAAGSAGHTRLGIEGEDLQGVHHALPFLKAIRSGNQPALNGRVVVIGGGNAAVDAAQSALRLGAGSVTIVSLESEREMPAFKWAIAGARGEGVGVVNSLGPVRFLSERGMVRGVEFVHCVRVYDGDGRFSPRFDSCRVETVEAESVIIAAGQSPDLDFFGKIGIARDGKIVFDPLTMGTMEKGLFCAGDMAGGPGSVVEAMASGRRAAESAHRFLSGEHLRYGRAYRGPVETKFEIVTENDVARERVSIPGRKFTGRGDFTEIEQCLDEETARKEARRCISCGQAYGKYRTCWFCLPCEIECPHKALRVEIPYLLR